jgi:gamma-glutamylcyclotransferase (GGCT)/AIG2-like uncharacterized protein YtfP
MTEATVSAGPTLLFVYGTLKAGQPHHPLLSDCRCLGPARIPGTLYALPEGYPAAVPEGAGTIEGELYALPEWAETVLETLDDYEDVPAGLFVRERCEVGGRAAWVYYAGPRLWPRLRRLRPLPDGRWPPEPERPAEG